MHVDVAKLCIAHGKHLVTASYISPEMKELEERSVICGNLGQCVLTSPSAARHYVVLLGECGLDPGIDSM
jgi:alpha-aminoadipic semialdehyde synthase